MVERRELKPGEESKTHLNKAKNTKRSIGHDQLLACMPITNAERERERERERSREREVERGRERGRERERERTHTSTENTHTIHHTLTLLATTQN